MNDIRPELLEQVANWLDIYDKMAAKMLDGNDEASDALEVVSGSQVQDDLRRWAFAIRVGAARVEFDENAGSYFIRTNVA